MQPLTTLSSDYVELQLRLADKVVDLGLCAMDQAVLRYTNLARRFGLEPDEATSDKHWRDYVARLQTLGPISARADLTTEVANTFGQVTGRRQYAICCGPFVLGRGP